MQYIIALLPVILRAVGYGGSAAVGASGAAAGSTEQMIAAAVAALIVAVIDHIKAPKKAPVEERAV